MFRLGFIFLAAITLIGCSDKNDNGQTIVTRNIHSECISGWEYFLVGKGVALSVDKDGHPIKCSMIKDEE